MVLSAGQTGKFRLSSSGTMAGSPPVEAQFWCVPWASVERFGPERYDEAFLADLRMRLQGAGQPGSVWLEARREIPPWAASLPPPEQDAAFVAALVHTARRVKDCPAAAGFAGDFPPALRSDLTAGLKKYPRFVVFEPKCLKN